MGVFLWTCVWNSAFLGLNQTFLWIFWQFAWRLTVKNFHKKVWFRPKKPGFQTRVRKNTPISARLKAKRPARAAPLFKRGSKLEIHDWPLWRIKTITIYISNVGGEVKNLGEMDFPQRHPPIKCLHFCPFCSPGPWVWSSLPRSFTELIYRPKFWSPAQGVFTISLTVSGIEKCDWSPKIFY